MRLLQLKNGHQVKVDDDVYVWASKINWWMPPYRPGRKCYVLGRVNGETKALHRVIMGDPPGLLVDHRFADTLDCRRENLRVATFAQNAANKIIRRGELRGVKFRPRWQLWEARIFFGKICYRLGRFKELRDATDAYDRMASKIRGEFAWTHNCPDDVRQLRSVARRNVEHMLAKEGALHDLAFQKRRQEELMREENIEKLEYFRRAREQDALVAAHAQRRENRTRAALARAARGRQERRQARAMRKPTGYRPAQVATGLGLSRKAVLARMAAGEFGELVNVGTLQKPDWRISESGFKNFGKSNQ